MLIVCLYLFPCLYPLKIQACCTGIPQLSELSESDSEFIGFVSLLVVKEREEGVVALNLPNGPLKTCSGLDPVLSCLNQTVSW